MNTMQKAALCAAASLLVVSLLTACGGEAPDGPADSEKPGSSTSQGGNDATEKPEKPGEEKPDGTQQPDNVQPPDYLKNEIEFKNSWAYQQLGGILRGEGYYLNYDCSGKILKDKKTIGTMGYGNVIATGADKVCYRYSTLSGGAKEDETQEELRKWVRVNDQQYNQENYWLDSKKKTVSCTVTLWPAEYVENEIVAVSSYATVCPYEIYTSILPMENEGNFYRGTYTVNGVSYEAEMNFFESRIYCFEGGTLKYIVIRSPYDGQGCVVESIFRINKLTKTPQKNLLQIPSDYKVKK